MESSTVWNQRKGRASSSLHELQYHSKEMLMGGRCMQMMKTRLWKCKHGPDTCCSAVQLKYVSCTKKSLTRAKINKTGFRAHSNYFILIDIKRNNQFMLEGIWVLNIHTYVKSGFKKCNKEKQCQSKFMSCILLTSFAKEVSWDPEGYGLTFLYLIHIQNS